MKSNQIVRNYILNLIPISKKFNSIHQMISEIIECHEMESRVYIMHNIGEERSRINKQNNN